MDQLTQLILGLFGLLIGALMWFVRGKLNGYDRKHAEHFEDSADLAVRLSALNQNVADHTAVDAREFGAIERSLGVIQADIKQLIRDGGSARAARQ